MTAISVHSSTAMAYTHALRRSGDGWCRKVGGLINQAYFFCGCCFPVVRSLKVCSFRDIAGGGRRHGRRASENPVLAAFDFLPHPFFNHNYRFIHGVATELVSFQEFPSANTLTYTEYKVCGTYILQPR